MKDGGQEGQAPKWFKPGNKDKVKQGEEKDYAFVSKEVAYSAISAFDFTVRGQPVFHSENILESFHL